MDTGERAEMVDILPELLDRHLMTAHGWSLRIWPRLITHSFGPRTRSATSGGGVPLLSGAETLELIVCRMPA